MTSLSPTLPFYQEINTLYTKAKPYIAEGLSKASHIAKIVYDFALPLLQNLAHKLQGHAEAFYGYAARQGAEFKGKAIHAYDCVTNLVENLVSGQSFEKYGTLNDQQKSQVITKSFLTLLSGYALGAPALIAYSITALSASYFINDVTAKAV